MKLRILFPFLACYLLFAFSLTARAHECRELGQPNQFGTQTKGCTIAPCGWSSYFICAGFAYEDPAIKQPGAGKRNNLDFFPLWIDVKGDQHPIDTTRGDKLKVTATLYYMNNKVYEVPTDENFNVTEPYFFLKTKGIGYESKIATDTNGKKRFQKTIKEFVQVPESVDAISYRAKSDFVLPYTGMYQWIIKGMMQRRGMPPATFETKWTCQQPRLPYGAWDPNVIPETLMDGPEGWFDCVRYPKEDGNLTTPDTASAVHGSPPFQTVLDRLR